MFTGLKEKRVMKTDTEVKWSICYKADEHQAETQKMFLKEIRGKKRPINLSHRKRHSNSLHAGFWSERFVTEAKQG